MLLASLEGDGPGMDAAFMPVVHAPVEQDDVQMLADFMSAAIGLWAGTLTVGLDGRANAIAYARDACLGESVDEILRPVT